MHPNFYTSNALYYNSLTRTTRNHYKPAAFSPFFFCINTAGGVGLNFGSNNPAYIHIPNQPLPSPRITRDQQNISEHTIDNNLHAGSLGCAPTPNQYFALDISSLISF